MVNQTVNNQANISLRSFYPYYMIRLLITPETNELNIAIPDDYVGKKVGVLVFALDEVSEPPVRKNVMAQFWNVISDKSTAEMHKHIEQSRSEWERDI